MSTFKIIIYLILGFIAIQIMRQIINIIENKNFPKKCLNNNKVTKVNSSYTNIVLIGDDTILGSKLFNCKNTLAKQLSDQTNTNVYQFGKSDLKIKDLYEFIKTKWLDINSIDVASVVICIGHNDITSFNYDIDSKYLVQVIKLLKTISNNIYLMAPRDIYNDRLYVFPFNYLIKKRTNELSMVINNIADNNNLKVIDVKKDTIYQCKNGKYCRVGDDTSLDENGYQVIAKVIKDSIIDQTENNTNKTSAGIVANNI